MECRSCFAVLKDGMKYCHLCGIKVELEVKCSTCGELLGPDDKFCSDCGTKVDSSNLFSQKKTEWDELDYSPFDIYEQEIANQALRNQRIRGNSIGNMIATTTGRTPSFVADENNNIYFAEGNSIYVLLETNTLGKLQKTKVDISLKGSDRISELNLWNNELYFTCHKIFGSLFDYQTIAGMYKLKDGHLIKISDDLGGYVNIIDGWIYYSLLEMDEQKICKMRTDGTENTVLMEDVRAFYLQVVDDWIYYSDAGVYRISTDGRKKEKLYEYLDFLNVSGSYLYGTDLTKLVEINLATGESRVIKTKGRTSFINVIGSNMYYSDYDKIYRYDLDLETDFIVTNPDGNDYLAVHDNYVYYGISGDNYRINIDGSGRPQKI